MPLIAETPILLVDCAAVDRGTRHGQLLEIAWHAAPPSLTYRIRYSAVRVVVMAPAEGAFSWRPPVRTVTVPEGSWRDDSSVITEPEEAWARLCAAAEEVAAAGGSARAVAVMHEARHKRRVLEQLQRQFGYGPLPPYDLYCTDEIARRLLPLRPARGLRALAGHLGLVIRQPKRAAAQVVATGLVWHRLVEQLEIEHGVRTIAALRRWLDADDEVGGEPPYDPRPGRADESSAG